MLQEQKAVAGCWPDLFFFNFSIVLSRTISGVSESELYQIHTLTI